MRTRTLHLPQGPNIPRLRRDPRGRDPPAPAILGTFGHSRRRGGAEAGGAAYIIRRLSHGARPGRPGADRIAYGGGADPRGAPPCAPSCRKPQIHGHRLRSGHFRAVLIANSPSGLAGESTAVPAASRLHCSALGRVQQAPAVAGGAASKRSSSSAPTGPEGGVRHGGSRERGRAMAGAERERPRRHGRALAARVWPVRRRARACADLPAACLLRIPSASG